MIHLPYDELLSTLQKSKDINNVESQLHSLSNNYVHDVADPTAKDVTSAAVAHSMAVAESAIISPPLSAAMVSKALTTVYEDKITPIAMAKLLKSLDYSMNDIALAIHDNYPNQTADDLILILLDEDMYPDATKSEVSAALYAANFDQSEIDPAINKAFPEQGIEASANFSQPKITTTGNMKVITGQGMVFNQQYKHSWKMLYPGRSFLEARFSIAHTKPNVDLILVNLTSSMGSKAGYSPVDIVINGKLFKDNYNPGSMNYKKDTFSIGSFLQDGENIIRIEFQSKPWAKTHYWIKSLEVKG